MGDGSAKSNRKDKLRLKTSLEALEMRAGEKKAHSNGKNKKKSFHLFLPPPPFSPQYFLVPLSSNSFQVSRAQFL